ncbi:catalase family protein [Gordonia sp. PKS22-38]|uniref:Catalase family protein n=1 Tax=Gordonia prachuapensis TaxID=3115651 RepID=A0ABU7N0D7_9ACTN|nr:catalase family protein [Gordonia sp. PKS22-38]
MTDVVTVAGTYERFREGIETPRDDEDADIEKIVRVLRSNNERAYRKNKRGLRDAHAKGHGILRGELEVLDDLDDELAQGMFATPRVYPIVARLSSTSGAIRSDQLRGVRGLGVKVIGVDGERALPDDTANTQDFIMVTHREFLFADAHEYSRRGMAVAWTLARLSDTVLKRGSEVLDALNRRVLDPLGVGLPHTLSVFIAPNTHILGDTFHSSAPLRHGDYMVKMRLVPRSPEVRALVGAPMPDNGGVNALAESVIDFFALHDAEYELQVQLCTDLESMPIEDATKEWDHRRSPYRPVAVIRYPRQNPYTPERRAFGDDVLSFNSWRGLDAHRPLGSINRLKKRVYEASSQYRHQVNHAPMLEPSDESQLPT